MNEIRYRVELWNGDSWERATHEYKKLEDAERRLADMIANDHDETAFRLVKCTYEVISARAILQGDSPV